MPYAMSGTGNRSSARKLSKAPVRSVPEAAEPLRRKTSIAIEAIEPSFNPGRLSHHYSRNIDVETPFSDDNCVDSEGSENEHTSDGEHDSRYSIVPSTHGQAIDVGFLDKRLEREQGHTWERLEESREGNEASSVFPVGIEATQQAEEIDPSDLKKEELITLVSDLQLQLRQLKNVQSHELVSKAQRKSSAELVNDAKALRETVSTWADRYFRHESILSKDTGKRLDTLKVIVDEPEVYIKDSFLRTRLIQARMWDLLQYHIFDDDRKGERKYYGHIWTGGRAKRTWLKDAVTKENEQVDRDMRPLDDVLRPEANADESAWKKYLEWRSSTYNLLIPPDRKMMIDEAELVEQNRIVSDRIWKSLRSFAKPRSSRQARGELRRLVWRSMWLDLDFRQQPVQFEIRRPWLKLSVGPFPFQYYGMHFDPETMSDYAPLYHSGAPLVAINTAPALFKSHDWAESAGQEDEVCLLKAQVCCSIPPRE
ncbi:hypothetical protein E6O75_ATG01185 [Venturia nashicola]|uniref:Uncharacterized protein n=1 Tax=Venturia nashicola TaxID=86259 RepID=A0A4Z1PBD6_9PEZI|nr:hypothetical protein E6O75_ATG01185 [Venturia nashicola]